VEAKHISPPIVFPQEWLNLFKKKKKGESAPPPPPRKLPATEVALIDFVCSPIKSKQDNATDN